MFREPTACKTCTLNGPRQRDGDPRRCPPRIVKEMAIVNLIVARRARDGSKQLFCRLPARDGLFFGGRGKPHIRRTVWKLRPKTPKFLRTSAPLYSYL